MAASLLLLQLPRRLGRAARAAPQLLASPQLLVLQQARRDFRAVSVAARSTLSSSTAEEEEPRPPRPPPPSPTDPLRVAVVGSGPAGCYAASELFKRLGESVRVDILDKLPTPFGLVRSGVAPDHQDTKNVTNQFERVLRDGRARFFGNVEVVGDGGGGWRGAGDDDGRGDESAVAAADAAACAASSSSSSSSPAPPPSPSSSAPLPVRLQDLRGIYDAVVLAHGAESATPLGLPLLLPRRKKEGGGKGGKAGGGESKGELLSTSSLPFYPSPASSSGVVTARDFILWANGHPELSALGLDLRNLRSAVVVGAGNVALDCARLLLRGQRELLERTDASRAALSAALALDSSDDDDDDEEEEEGENKEEKEKKDDSPPRRTVHVVARRGAAQAAFSAKELREALSLPGVSVFVHHPPPFLGGDGDELLDPADRAELAASRRAARVFELLRKKAAEGEEEEVGWKKKKKKKKELHFHFLRSPVELIAAAEDDDDDDGASSSSSPPRVAAVRLVANRLETRQGRDGRERRVAVAVAASDDGDGDKGDGGDGGVPASSPPSSSPSSPSSTPTFLTLPAQLVIAALGFRTPSLGEGTPYDEERGVVPSGAGGRALPSPSEGPAAALSSSSPSSSPSSSSSPPSPARPLRGLYVTGWARRGPTGIIGENLRDAAEVADAVASDAAELMMTREGEKKGVSSSSSSSTDLLSLLRLSSSSTSPRVVGVEGWARIDALEKEAAAREVEERRRSEKERRKTTTTTRKKGGGDEEDGGGDASSSAAIAPPRVKILSAEELLRAAGV